MSGYTLDSGALIALDRNDRVVVARLGRAGETRRRVTIPASALAQAMRNPARQARLSRLIRQPEADLMSLNGPDATAVGLLLAATGCTDVVDAHVAVCARRAKQPVLTSDPDDLRRIDPSLRLIRV